jgi:hypothetical protein
MRYFFHLLCLLFLSSVLLIGCDNNSTTPIPTERGTLQIGLTDAAAAFEAVNITFSEISAHIDEQWITVRGEPITVNLLEWNNGKSIVLGIAEVPAGHYTQIRLKIDQAEVVTNGQTHEAEVPSGDPTGLKLVHQFTINAGSTYELIIDFDAHRSIVTTGPPNDPKYKLKPTIRVIPKAITGSISATVTNPEHLPIAYAIIGTDTVTTTVVDKTSGKFMLAFLSPATYRVTVGDTLKRAFVKDGVEVVAGTNQDLGEVSLQ